MIYLENRGFKPIETEVFIEGFGIVDVASFVYPTPIECHKLRLANEQRFGLDKQDYGDIQFRYGHILTAVIEVKVTRADWLRDKETKFKQRAPAHLCYLAYPKDLLEAKDLPEGWLGLEMDSTGYRVNRRHWNWPMVHPQHPGDVVDFVGAVAIKADHRTRFARHRTMMKMQRAKDGLSRRKVNDGRNKTNEGTTNTN